MYDNSAFHIHTFRCKHAENVSDEEYVKKTIELGYSDIWFTDHVPFPGDPFGHRMDCAQLPEYIDTLKKLREKYPAIGIHIGLETEYLPSFDKCGYYEELKENKDIELLLLGQHMAEISDDPIIYSFEQDRQMRCQNEFIQLGNAIVQGIDSGYFDAVAHPDRIFRHCSKWTDEMNDMAKRIICGADRRNISLEINISSMEYGMYYRKEFWALVPESVNKVIGFDAHSVEQFEKRSEFLLKCSRKS